MEKKSVASSVALLTGAILIVSGAWVMINDVLGDKQGLLFEGILTWSLGLLLILAVAITERIGKAINTFTDVFNKQADIQQYLTQKFNEERIQKNNLANMLGGHMTYTDPNGNPKTVNINDQEEMMKAINESFKMFGTKSWDYLKENNKSLEELEEELAQAVAEENFEKAEKIKKQIAFIKNLDDPTGQEDDSDEPGDQ